MSLLHIVKMSHCVQTQVTEIMDHNARRKACHSTGDLADCKREGTQAPCWPHGQLPQVSTPVTSLNLIYAALPTSWEKRNAARPCTGQSQRYVAIVV